MLENRPIVCAVIGYIIGIIVGLYCKISIVLLYLFLIPIYLNLNKPKKSKFKLISLKRYFRYIKIIFTSKALKIIIIFSIISNTVTIYQNQKYEKIYINENKEITIKGKIVSNPKEKDYKKIYKLKTNQNTNFYLSVKNNLNINLEYGDEIIIVGTYKKPSGKRNYKGFDYSQYLKTLKIYGTINLKSIKNVNKSKNSIFKISNDIFLKVKKYIEDNFDYKTGNIILGITMGYTDNIDKQTRENFTDSNISHILAISGMHIGYITICIKFILEKLIGKRKSKIGTSIIITMYMFITGFSPSIVRAGIMAIIAMLSTIFYRKSDTWENIGLSLLILLIYNPFLIKSTSLLLSFAGTIGIIVLQKNIKSITFSATLFVMPIISVCFNQVAISSLFISIIIGYIIGPIIILGFSVIFLCPIIEKLRFIIIKNICISMLNKMIQILMRITEIGSSLPLNKIFVTTPNIIEIIIYYSIILIRKFFNFNI